MSLRLVNGGAPKAEEVDTEIRPFKDFAEMYYANGWIPLPLPPRAKASPPSKSTGRYNTPNWKQVKTWIQTMPDASNIALRMSPYAFGVDVDNYGDKPGGATLDLVEAETGLVLPATYVSSARTDGVSGIRYFRFPDSHYGKHLPGDLGPGVEIVQHRHRYAVAPPSIHPEFERHYRWYAPNQPVDGSGTFNVPVVRKVARMV